MTYRTKIIQGSGLVESVLLLMLRCNLCDVGTTVLVVPLVSRHGDKFLCRAEMASTIWSDIQMRVGRLP